MAWVQTYTGQVFNLTNPQPAMVNLQDIAHSLAFLCRFTGHTIYPFSVAAHSMMVASLVPEEYRLQALLHDAHEAYIGDISTPLKSEIPAYRAVNNRVWNAVADAFRIPRELHPSVKHADRVMLMTERRDLLTFCPEPWAAEYEAVQPRDTEIRPADCEGFGMHDAWRFERAVTEEITKRRAAA